VAKRQIKETGEARRLSDRDRIVAEFSHAIDAWSDNNLRLLAEGLALERAALDAAEQVPNRIFCIQAALRTWRELHSLQSDVIRLAMLFAAGRSPIPDDTAEDIKALRAAGEYGLKMFPRRQEKLRQWITEGEKTEAELKELPTVVTHYDVHGAAPGHQLSGVSSLTGGNVITAFGFKERLGAEDLSAKLDNNPDVVTDIDHKYTDDMGNFTLEQLEAAERELAKRRGLTLAQYHAALSRFTQSASEVEPAVWPSEKWKRSQEFLRRVWKPFIEATGAVVTRRILAEIDPAAAAALTSALRSSPMPADIGIIATKDLKRDAVKRPAIFRPPSV
jgi:hypothetical protein